MKKIFDLLKIIFISPEVLFVLLVLFSSTYKPEWIIFLAIQLKNNIDILKYLALIPTIFTSLVLKLGKDIWLPENKNKILYEWEEHYKIKFSIIFGIIISIICSLLAILNWLFFLNISPLYSGAIIISTIGVSGISYFTMYLASIQINEILISTNKND